MSVRFYVLGIVNNVIAAVSLLPREVRKNGCLCGSAKMRWLVELN